MTAAASSGVSRSSLVFMTDRVDPATWPFLSQSWELPPSRSPVKQQPPRRRRCRRGGRHDWTRTGRRRGTVLPRARPVENFLEGGVDDSGEELGASSAGDAATGRQQELANGARRQLVAGLGFPRQLGEHGVPL